VVEAEVGEVEGHKSANCCVNIIRVEYEALIERNVNVYLISSA